jgi:hypothetical protein
MKGDLSRRTFLAVKHYHSVQMQQGRVQLDADWNEQVDLAAHRVETETIDVIGDCGGPQADAAFAITRISNTDFTLGAGRYYVDGLLLANEAAVAYSAQPDLLNIAPLVSGERYLAYLDVWERHVTFLDDPYLREVALGGPDTSTRERTIWQVKVAKTADLNCVDAWATFFPPQPPTGRMRAGTVAATVSDNPCLVRPTAGYRGLENQLYRIEIHKPGVGFDLATAPAITVTFNPATPTRIVAGGGAWAVGDAVQITSTTSPDAGPVFLITAAAGTTLDLNAEVHDVTFDAGTRVRRVTGAVFKWSRDNGAIATRIKTIDPTRLKLVVDSLGPDDVLGFRDGDFVELSDDRAELGGPGPGEARPGEIIQIKKVYPGTNTIELVSPATFTIDTIDTVNHRHPTLRKWNGLGMVTYHAASLDAIPPAVDRNWIEIELGLQVRFTRDALPPPAAPVLALYRTADYWQIAARASNADGRSGNIEWPYPAGEEDQSPFGVVHHFCPLAVLDLAAALPGDQVKDCRSLFPPLTQLKRLCYVGGDGQEVMPDLTLDPGALTALPHPLRVGVVNGLHKVVGARIEFTIVEGDDPPGDQITDGFSVANGLNGALITTTGPDGIAVCKWLLRGPVDLGRQVRARLLNATDDPEDVPPILFGAGRSVAREVAFLPPTGCDALVGAKTVQTAIEVLAHVRTMQAVGGDGQDGLPGAALPLPIEVEVRDHCGPIVGARVLFSVATGGLGVWPTDPTVAAPLPTRDDVTDVNGRAQMFWRLGAGTGPQEAVAKLIDGPPVGLNLRFTANAVLAINCGEKVAHSAAELRDILTNLPPKTDAHICIAPGLYEFDSTIDVIGKGHLKISAAGDATVLRGRKVESVLRFTDCASVTMRDLRIDAIHEGHVAHEGGALHVSGCGRVTLEHLRVSTSAGSYREAACIAVVSKPEQTFPSVRIRSCDLTVGDGQIGILIVNADRAEIEDNTVQVASSGPGLGFRAKLAAERHQVIGRVAYGRYVDGVNKYFMHPTVVTVGSVSNAPPPHPPPPIVHGLYVSSLENRLLRAVGNNAALVRRMLPYLLREGTQFTAEGQSWNVRFEAPVPLLEPWLALLRSNPLPPPVKQTAVKDHLSALSDRLVTAYLDAGPNLPSEFAIALNFLAKQDRAIGAQGIVVAGRVFGETRILENTVNGFAIGIHAGNSENDQQYRRARRTIIAGNTVTVRLNGEYWFDRHGIFSGNSENTIIEGNTITADLAPMALALRFDGIRAYGVFGPMLMIRANQMLDCPIGVRVRALNPASQPASVWRVTDNAVRGTTTPFDITPPMP